MGLIPLGEGDRFGFTPVFAIELRSPDPVHILHVDGSARAPVGERVIEFPAIDSIMRHGVSLAGLHRYECHAGRTFCDLRRAVNRRLNANRL